MSTTTSKDWLPLPWPYSIETELLLGCSVAMRFLSIGMAACWHASFNIYSMVQLNQSINQSIIVAHTMCVCESMWHTRSRAVRSIEIGKAPPNG